MKEALTRVTIELVRELVPTEYWDSIQLEVSTQVGSFYKSLTSLDSLLFHVTPAQGLKVTKSWFTTSRVAFATGKSVPTLKENASSVGLAGSFVDALFAFPSGEDQHAERALLAVKQKCTLLTFGWHLGKSGVVYPRLFGLDPGTCVEDEGEFLGLREAKTDDEFIASIMFVWLVELSAVNGASMLSKDSDNSLAGRAHAAKQLMQYSEGMTFSAMRTFVLRNRIAPIGLMLAGRKWLYPAFEIARMI